MSQIFKIMLIGDMSTGKTSFLSQLIYQKAEKMPKPTTQLSFFTLRISSPQTIIQIWDTPGDPKYSFKAISILQKFKAVLIFVDVSNQHTLNRAKLIIDRNEELKIYPKISIYIILSKIDIVEKMPYKRKVNFEQVQSLASGVDGLAFDYSFDHKIQEILQKIVINYSQKSKNQKAGKKGQRKIFGNEKGNLSEKKNASDSQFCQCLIS